MIINEELFIEKLEGIVDNDILTTSEKKAQILNIPDRTFLEDVDQCVRGHLDKQISFTRKQIENTHNDIEEAKTKLSERKKGVDAFDCLIINGLEENIERDKNIKKYWESRLLIYVRALDIIKEG